MNFGAQACAQILLVAAASLWIPSTAESAGVPCSNWITGPLQHISMEGADGAVHAAVVWDPDGAGPRPELLVVGGDFTRIGGVWANRIAAWDGFVWRPLGGGLDGTVRTLSVFNGLLIVGGSFQSAGGLPTLFVAAWNDVDWIAMDEGISSGAGVYALTVWNGQLYAGGDLVLGLRRWDGPSGTWTLFAAAPDGPVHALAGFGGHLYIGGNFTHVGVNAIRHVARWNGLAWNDLEGGVDDTVFALVVHQGSLYVGGAFRFAGNDDDYDLSYVARFDGSIWHYLDCGNACELDATVYTLASIDGSLYAGGSFSQGGVTGDIRRVAQLNGTYWDPVGAGIGPGSYTGEAVRALAGYSGALVAGGNFSDGGTNLTHWDGSEWSDLITPVTVRAIATFGSKVALAGVFPQTAPGILNSWNIGVWNGLDLTTLTTGTNAPVHALLGYSDTVFPQQDHLVVGGAFTTAGGVIANRVALWSESVFTPGPGWTAIGNGFNGDVRALARLNGKIVAGGMFTFSGGSSRNYIARWDGTAWQSLGTGMNGPVFALKTYPGLFSSTLLVAGGLFTTANGGPASCIAYWTGNTMTAEVPWAPLGAGLNAAVYALERHGGVLHAGGEFTASGGTPVNHVAQFVSNNWVPVGGGLDGAVRALRSDGGYLYAAGDFTGRVARLEGSNWVVLNGGTDGTAFALDAYQGEILVGGTMSTGGTGIGTVATDGALRYPKTGAPWIARHPSAETVDEGGAASFTVMPADGYHLLAFSWRRSGIPLLNGPTGHGSTISGANTATLVLSGTAVADTGRYDCVVSNSCGSATSGAAPLTVNSVSAVPIDTADPGLALSARPNPFRRVTEITFSLPGAGVIDLLVFDLKGAVVRRLHAGSRPSGPSRFSWDGRDALGRTLPAGHYFVQLRAVGAQETRRVLLVK